MCRLTSEHKSVDEIGLYSRLYGMIGSSVIGDLDLLGAKIENAGGKNIFSLI